MMEENTNSAPSAPAAPAAPIVTTIPDIETLKDLLLWPVTEDDAKQARDMLQSLHFNLSMAQEQTPTLDSVPIDRINLLDGRYITRHPAVTKSGSMWWLRNSHSLLRALTASECELVQCALAAPQRHAQAAQCFHDDTHREGAIWEVCDQCGKRWADDANPRAADSRAALNAQAAQPFVSGAMQAMADAGFDVCVVADSRVTGNAKASLSDEKIEAIRHAASLLDLEGYGKQSADLFNIIEPAAAPVAAAVQGEASEDQILELSGWIGYEQGRASGLEEAAKVCVAQNDTDWPTPLGCAAAIRAAIPSIVPPAPHVERDAVLLQALHDIANPIEAMRREVPEGYLFEGAMAISQASSPEWYKRRAQLAIDAAMAAQQGEKGAS